MPLLLATFALHPLAPEARHNIPLQRLLLTQAQVWTEPVLLERAKYEFQEVEEYLKSADGVRVRRLPRWQGWREPLWTLPVGNLRLTSDATFISL